MKYAVVHIFIRPNGKKYRVVAIEDGKYIAELVPRNQGIGNVIFKPEEIE